MVSTEFDVFLSHNSRDKREVRLIAKELLSRGIRVWLDEWEVRPGSKWQDALVAGIQASSSAAVLVGKDGLGPWEEPEVQVLLSQSVERELRVIPVLLPNATEPSLPPFLRNFARVDLRAGITPERLDKLVWGITGESPNGVPADPPTPPQPAEDTGDSKIESSSEENALMANMLNLTFRPIGELLRSVLKEAVFFLAPHPTKWDVQYCGLPGDPDPETAKKIWEDIDGILANNRRLKKDLDFGTTKERWRAIDQLATDLRDRLTYFAGKNVFKAAIALLSKKSFRMGHVVDPGTGDGSLFSTAFVLPDRKPETPGWFQDALVFASDCAFLKEQFEERRHERGAFCQYMSEFGDNGDRARILTVSNYMKREGLINGRAEIFVNEYLYYCGAQDTKHILDDTASVDARGRPRDTRKRPPSQIHHHFLPIRGLGQWRATACWLSHEKFPESSGAGQSPITEPFHRALEGLCTRSVLEVFTLALLGVLSKSFKSDPARLREVYRAFAILWWANEICFLCNNICVLRASRDSDGNHLLDLKSKPEPPREDSSDFLKIEPIDDAGPSAGADRYSTHRVIIRLRNLSGLLRGIAESRLGFDEVHFKINLFRMDGRLEDTREQIASLGRQLEERIRVVLEVAPDRGSTTATGD